MKIQFASDLHLEFLAQRFPGYRCIEPADADLLVLAGDIGRHQQAIAAFADWPAPVLYVHGNHESYGAHYGETVQRLRQASAGSRVRYLECDEIFHGGMRFLGCCLWTDYLLDPERKEETMAAAAAFVTDHKLIRTDHGLFTTQDSELLHAQSRAWLEERLEQAYDGPTVVITHHAPHPLSVHPRYQGSPVNGAFASDLTPLMGKAALWIHGHMHDSFDYQVNGTRVVANPRGYARNHGSAARPEELEWENPLFDPRLVVEVN